MVMTLEELEGPIVDATGPRATEDMEIEAPSGRIRELFAELDALNMEALALGRLDVARRYRLVSALHVAEEPALEATLVAECARVASRLRADPSELELDPHRPASLGWREHAWKFGVRVDAVIPSNRAVVIAVAGAVAGLGALCIYWHQVFHGLIIAAALIGRFIPSRARVPRHARSMTIDTEGVRMGKTFVSIDRCRGFVLELTLGPPITGVPSRLVPTRVLLLDSQGALHAFWDRCACVFVVARLNQLLAMMRSEAPPMRTSAYRD